jgi:hypothetical protein
MYEICPNTHKSSIRTLSDKGTFAKSVAANPLLDLVTTSSDVKPYRWIFEYLSQDHLELLKNKTVANMAMTEINIRCRLFAALSIGNLLWR